MKKRVLILQWNSVNDNYGIIEAFKGMGISGSIVDLNGQDCREKYHIDFFDDYLKKNKFDLVYSTNYFDYLAVSCHNNGVPYIAWTYDSPARLDNPQTAQYDTSNIFMFDSCEVEKYRNRDGLKRVHYLPLAADIDRFEETLKTDYNIKDYATDISFVGSLYDSEINNYLNELSDYKKGFFNAIVDYCTGKYDINIVETLNSLNLLYWEDEEKFNDKVINDKRNGKLDIEEKKKAANISARVGRMAMNSITNKERLILVSVLSNHWKFKLYSTSTHEVFKTTEECGTIDYYTGMPKVFKNSRINLNVTNKGIKTGIPLRCMDIMGCGGLLLTNYQKDLDRHFKDGEDIVIYHSLDEAYEKCAYYLSHEDIRKKVARKGYETVKKQFTYPVLLKEALETAGLSYLIRQ